MSAALAFAPEAPAILPAAEARPTPLVELHQVSKRFRRKASFLRRLAHRLGGPAPLDTVHAVDRVDLKVAPGEVVGLVGESGCGKSTLGRIVAGIHQPSSGDVIYRGANIGNLRGEALQAYVRGVQMVFQDPFASLNPRLRVIDIIGEAPQVHDLVGRREVGEYVAELMEQVGLNPVFRHRYPHQFSGGQRQRICIARALAVRPNFLVCDEAVAALDVSIQAQIINLFMDLRDRLGLTYLFISHDLGVVQHVSDRIVIMYLGRVVEAAPTETLFAGPHHPYTRALVDEVPRMDGRRRQFMPIRGEIPSPLDPPKGCHFHPRCRFATARCRSEAPALREVAPGHVSACHLDQGAAA